MNQVRIGCSGWNYASWRHGFYGGRPPSRWLEHYATIFDTVEVNSTFYRLASREAVANWARQTPDDFCFALKASRFLTHMKRLTDMEQGVERFYERIEPLMGTPKLGPVLWQLPDRFARDDDRLAFALERLPPGRHAFELRHPTWHAPEVLELLRGHNVAMAVGDDPRRPTAPLEPTADFAFLRFHHGRRGRRGNYSRAELEEWAQTVHELRQSVEVFAYFNNDWEIFAPGNARTLRRLVERAGEQPDARAQPSAGPTSSPRA